MLFSLHGAASIYLSDHGNITGKIRGIYEVRREMKQIRMIEPLPLQLLNSVSLVPTSKMLAESLKENLRDKWEPT